MVGIRPVLTPDDVRDALDALYSAEPLPDHHPIRRFFMFQEAVNHPEVLGGDYGELAVWSQLIEELLLLQLDNRHNLPPEQLLKRDVTTGKTIQQGYSILYYRYCRSDLDWSLDDIAVMVDYNLRSIQRRHAAGLSRLTQQLVEAEMRFRRFRWEDVLRARIPLPPPEDVYGREDWLDSLQNALLNLQQPMLITGESGSGKTYLASALAHTLLPQFDDVIWLSLSPYQSVIPTLLEACGIADDEQLRRYAATRRILLILDHFEETHLDALAEGSPVWLMVTLALGRETLGHWSGLQWRVPLADELAAQRFFDRVRGDIPLAHFSKIFAQTRGNLGQMIHIIGQGQLPPQLGELERTILAWWGRYSDLDQPIIERLLDQTLPQGVHLSGQAVQWQLLWERWIAVFPQPTRAQWQHLFHHISWDELPHWLLENILTYGARFALRLGVREDWSAILAELQASWGKTPYGASFLTLENARLSRSHGQYVTAHRELQQLSQHTGQGGWFELQARTWLEMGWIAFYQGQYERAWSALQDSQRYLQGSAYQEEMDLLRLSCQIELGDSSLSIPNGLLFYPLAIEAYLRQTQPERALDYAQHLLDKAESESPLMARTLNDLARILAALGDLNAAIGYQAQAVNLFGFLGDDLAWARGLNNLATLYFQTEQYPFARRFWEQALGILVSLQDRLALQTVKANLALIP